MHFLMTYSDFQWSTQHPYRIFFLKIPIPDLLSLCVLRVRNHYAFVNLNTPCGSLKRIASFHIGLEN